MPSAHDTAIVARDSALRGLGLLLDADGFAAWLDAAAPGYGVRAAEPLYLRYKPGSSCVAGFRVATGGVPVELYAKAYTDEHFSVVANRREPARFSALAQPRLISHEHRFVVRHAAGDRELPGLRRLADPGLRAGVLQKLLALAGDDAELETVRYKAERRFVARVYRDRVPIALVKAYTKTDFPAALARARLADAAGLARLIGSAGDRRAIALEWRHGTPLDRLEAGALDAGVRQAGAALAFLHAGPVIPHFRRDRRQEVDAAFDAASAVSVLSPALGEYASRLVRRVADAFDAPAAVAATIHGDFSADQVLVAKGAVTIIDWDRLCAGEAASDLGSFVARVEADAATGAGSAAGAQAAITALFEGYEDIRHAIPEAIDLHTVLGLVRLAPEPFRCRLPDWPDRVAAILARAGAILDRSIQAGRPGRRAG